MVLRGALGVWTIAHLLLPIYMLKPTMEDKLEFPPIIVALHLAEGRGYFVDL